MSTMEKHIAKFLESKKRIIDQARKQCQLWGQQLSHKVVLDGIVPPPWLCNTSLHSLASDPNEVNKDDLVSGVPFPGLHCSLYSNLDVVSGDVKYPIGLHNEVHALKKDCNKGDGLSNLPDCSVNNDGCASSGPPELDSGAISPQNQMEPTVSDSYHNPALSLAKLQRSKSRQRALELRNSAKATKRWSGDDNNAGVCTATITGSASSTQQAGQIKESDFVKDFHSSIQSCSMEEVRRGDCLTQKDDKSNYSGHIVRSKSLSQKFNSLNVASSLAVKKDDPPSNNSNEPLELVNRPCFTNGSCRVKEANKAEYQSKEAGRSVYDKRLTKSRSSSQARYNSELLKLDSTSGTGKGVEVCDFMQPFTHVELTDLSKDSDCNNGSRRNIMKDGDFCHNKQEGNIYGRISSCPSPGDDFLTSGRSVKSVNKSVQPPQPLISQNSQDPAVSGKVYITRDSKSRNHLEEISKPLGSNFCEQSATCSESAGKKSQNVRPIEMDATRLSSSPKYTTLDTEIAMNSAEKENIAALAAFRNTRAMTTCADDGSLRPVSSSNLDDGFLLAESLDIETAAAKKVLDAQENILFGANPTDNVGHRSSAPVAKVDADFGGLVEKVPSCLGSRFTSVVPEVGLDVSVLRLPSDFVMSVMPKQLDFNDVGESSINGISGPDLKEGRQGMSPEEEPLNSLEPVNLHDEEISLVCQDKRNSSGEMDLLETQEVLIREEGPQMEYCASHFKEADLAMEALNDMSLNRELHMVQKEFCILTSSMMNHSSPSKVADENLSGNLSNEVIAVNSKLENNESNTKLADFFSAEVTGHGLHKYTDENVSNLTAGFPFTAPMDEVNVGLTQQAPNSISLSENGDSLRKTLLSDGKVTGFSTDFQISRSSTESFAYDVERSCPQHKRRKIEVDTEKFLPASLKLLEKPLDSIDQRPVCRNLSIEKDNPKAVLEVQHLTSDQDDDIGHQDIGNSSMDEMQGSGKCRTMEGSSLKVSNEEKLILDRRDRSADTLPLAETNLSSFSIDSTIRCPIDEKIESWHHQVNCGQESAVHLTCVERSTLSRTYAGGNAKFSDDLSVSPGIQCLDLIGTDETLPEFEGFIMQTDNAQPCTAGDQMELEKMNLPSNSIDYTSLDRSSFMHSPQCYSSTPYKFRNIPDLYQSLPNGLLEGIGMRTSLPLNDGGPRSLSDCLINCKGQYTSSVQTLWDRINSNFGSSGKRESLKLELPCISEENENVDEIADEFEKGIGLEGMTNSITRKPLALIIDNANHSTSVLQDDILTDGQEDFVSTGFNLSGTHNKVKKKLDKQDGYRRRFTGKGKEDQSISLGANDAKRTTESLCRRSSRPKSSGKDSMKQQTYSKVKSPCNNIVSNVTSFIPLVQQKQAAVVFTGKRDIKVKALEAAEAAKRLAEKKENERKMKKEALRIERERLELQLQKKKKEEERKKKEAEMAARKRKREDEEKKEKDRKKKRVNDSKKQLQELEKIHTKKEEIKIQRRATGEEAQESKKFMDGRENHKNLQLQENREDNVEIFSETEPLTIRDSANEKTKESCHGYSESVNDCANNGKVMGNLNKATEDDLIIKNSLQEQSYEISPYKESDDEDEDEDDIPNNKFIPSWASKRSLSYQVYSQKIDPETIFPRASSCDIEDVLRPRKIRLL